MSGGGGGDGGGGPPLQMQPVPQVDLKTSGYGGMGYTPVEQTFVPGAQPDWMQGWFGMPQWGMNAATGDPLTQKGLQPQPNPMPVDPRQFMPRPLAMGQGYYGMNDPYFMNPDPYGGLD